MLTFVMLTRLSPDALKSPKSFDLLDLEHDLPTTPEDIIALRRARECRPLEFSAYLRFLSNFPPASHIALRARKGPAGAEPFELR